MNVFGDQFVAVDQNVEVAGTSIHLENEIGRVAVPFEGVAGKVGHDAVPSDGVGLDVVGIGVEGDFQQTVVIDGHLSGVVVGTEVAESVVVADDESVHRQNGVVDVDGLFLDFCGDTVDQVLSDPDGDGACGVVGVAAFERHVDVVIDFDDLERLVDPPDVVEHLSVGEWDLAAGAKQANAGQEDDYGSLFHG